MLNLFQPLLLSTLFKYDEILKQFQDENPLKSDIQKRPFKKVLVEDRILQKMLSGKEVDEALNMRNYLGTAVKQVELVVKMTKRERKTRGLED